MPYCHPILIRYILTYYTIPIPYHTIPLTAKSSSSLPHAPPAPTLCELVTLSASACRCCACVGKRRGRPEGRWGVPLAWEHVAAADSGRAGQGAREAAAGGAGANRSCPCSGRFASNFAFFLSFVRLFSPLFLFLLPFGPTDGSLNVSVLTVVVLHTVHDHLLHHTDGSSVRMPVLDALLFKSAAAAHSINGTNWQHWICGSCNTATVAFSGEEMMRSVFHARCGSDIYLAALTWLHVAEKRRRNAW